MKKLFILAITLCSSLFTVDAADKKDLVDYVNPLVGSQSKLLSRQVILIRRLPCLGE